MRSLKNLAIELALYQDPRERDRARCDRDAGLQYVPPRQSRVRAAVLPTFNAMHPPPDATVSRRTRQGSTSVPRV